MQETEEIFEIDLHMTDINILHAEGLKQRVKKKKWMAKILTDVLSSVELQQVPQDSEYRNIGMISNTQFGTFEMNKIEGSPDEEVC